MRHAFLGETDDEAPLAAEVCVSSREASGGLIVPLEVPVRGTCPACGGRGEIWTECCADCRGTGDALFRHPVKLTLPAGIAAGTYVLGVKLGTATGETATDNNNGIGSAQFVLG